MNLRLQADPGRWSQLLLLAAALTFGSACQESPSSSAFAAAGRARELYDKGQFREAHELLSQVVRQSGPSAALLYNLGCALYRDNRLGEAIAAWESVRLVSPRDTDLLHNLEIAAARQVDRLPEIEHSMLQRLLERTVDVVSTDEWTLIAYAGWVLLVIALALRLVLREHRYRETWATAVFVLGVFWLVVLLAFARSWSQYHRPRAVLIATEVNLHGGPDGSGEKVATLREGLVMELLGTAGQDSRVRLSPGWQGFLPSSALQPVGFDVWSTPRSRAGAQ